jgi:hypothetical protein
VKRDYKIKGSEKDLKIGMKRGNIIKIFEKDGAIVGCEVGYYNKGIRER